MNLCFISVYFSIIQYNLIMIYLICFLFFVSFIEQFGLFINSWSNSIFEFVFWRWINLTINDWLDWTSGIEIVFF